MSILCFVLRYRMLSYSILVRYYRVRVDFIFVCRYRIVLCRISFPFDAGCFCFSSKRQLLTTPRNGRCCWEGPRDVPAKARGRRPVGLRRGDPRREAFSRQDTPVEGRGVPTQVRLQLQVRIACRQIETSWLPLSYSRNTIRRRTKPLLST